MKHPHIPQSLIKISIVGLCVAAVAGLASFNRLQSANLSDVSITTSNPRPSFRTALTAANSAGSSIITVFTTGYPSTTTAQLLNGDSVLIGNDGTASLYSVSQTNPASQFTTTTALGAGDADSGDAVIASQSANLTVDLTTVSAVTNGSFRILVPALATDALAQDGLPDIDGFDFGASGSFTCPADITGYDFGTPASAVSAVTINGSDYHSFVCPYTGAGAVGTAFDGGANGSIVISNLINPVPSSGHVLGTADSHRMIVQHLDNGNVVIDSTSVAIATIEAVQVTATIDPSISFSVAGVASGVTRCGTTTDVTTSAAAVPFGTLSLSNFTDAAQTLTVSTNATNGYSVTGIANDQLGLNGGVCVGDNLGADCIQDSRGDANGMTHTVSDEFNNFTLSQGFAYSIQNSDAATVPFQYNTVAGNCTGGFCGRQFADLEGSQSSVQLFGSTTTASNENIDVCYRVVPESSNTSGSYSNNITYTATATY